jgi:hypothetical protein
MQISRSLGGGSLLWVIPAHVLRAPLHESGSAPMGQDS